MATPLRPTPKPDMKCNISYNKEKDLPSEHQKNMEAWIRYTSSKTQEEIESMDFKELFAVFKKYQPMPIK